MRILIADDHPLVRDALARTLQLINPEVEVLQAATYDEIEARMSSSPDLVIVDLNMPGMNGVEGIRRLRESFPQQSFVVASGEQEPAIIRSILATGVAGFLPKSESPDLLMQAIRLVLSGGTYVPVSALADAGKSQPQRPNAAGLTARQLDVLRLLMRGEPNKIIARQLDLTEGTVKIHIAAILRALQARNRTEAVVVAKSLGI
jgi:DNA-binding NarL/FixJ family response regulator